MTDRIDWTALRRAEVIVPVVLLAGVPVVLVPSGLAPTATSWTTGTPDPAWWPGSGALTVSLPGGATWDPVRAWLAPGWPVRIQNNSRPVRGETEVGPVYVDLVDDGGAVTAAFSAPRGATTRLLAASIASSTATAVTLDSVAGLPASGIAHVGREAVIYSAIVGSALTIGVAPATRGAFGSFATAHAAPEYKRPVVTIRTWPRYLHGRRATVWLARLVGTTLVDPTLVFDGRVGSGPTCEGARWSIPLDHVSKVLTRTPEARTLELYGFAHTAEAPGLGQPLVLRWDAIGAFPTVRLTGAASSPHNAGWHPDLQAFRQAFEAACTAALGGAYVATAARDDKVVVTVTAPAGGAGAQVASPLGVTPDGRVACEAGSPEEFAFPATEACFWLQGPVRVPDPAAFAAIPATLEYTDVITGATAGWAVRADSDDVEALVAPIGWKSSSGPDAIGLRAPLGLRAGLSAVDREKALRCTRRTTGELVAVATAGPSAGWWSAYLALAGLLAAAGGVDAVADAFDWFAIEAATLASPSTLPGDRTVIYDGEHSLLELFVNDARLNGFAVGFRGGRISLFRSMDCAPTEAAVAAIDTATDLVAGTTPRVQDTPDGLTTVLEFEPPEGAGAPIRVTDITHQDDFGDGETVSAFDPGGLTSSLTRGALTAALVQIQQAVLGAVAVPYRVIELVLPGTAFGLQQGDLVTLTDRGLPNDTGTRGYASATCQVQDVSLEAGGGRCRATVRVRPSDPDLAGYAPSALVAPGGLVALSKDVVLDDASGFGPSGFAPAYTPDGTAVTDGGASWFQVGDKVRLRQLARTLTVADETFTVAVVDPATRTLTLDAAPTAPMVALAASRYGVLVEFQGYGAATAAQRRYCYVGDDATGTLGADDPRRWAP